MSSLSRKRQYSHVQVPTVLLFFGDMLFGRFCASKLVRFIFLQKKQWSIQVVEVGGRDYITPKRRQELYRVYKRYILPIG